MALADEDPRVEVIVTVWVDPTARWVTTKVPELRPAGIVRVVGTVATEVFELDRLIVTPDGPAYAFRRTLAVTTVPELPTTVDGES